MDTLLELFLNLFVRFVTSADHLFQRSIPSAIPDHEELFANPANYLARQEIMIGPLRRNLGALALALALGPFVCCPITIWSAEHPHGRVGRAPWPRIAFLVSTPMLSVAIFFLVFRRMLRTGEVVIRTTGVVFRRRGASTFVPWAVFDSNAFSPCPWSRLHWLIPTDPEAAHGIVLSRNGLAVSVGPGVHTPYFHFRKDGALVLANVYAVRMKDLSSLFQQLGQKLGPFAARLPLPLPRDHVPEEMI